MKTPSLPLRFTLLLSGALFAFGAMDALAQQNFQRKPPHIGYVIPAGAQRGTTCEITVGGQFLEGTKALLVSGSGITATVVGYEKPLSQKKAGTYRDLLKQAREKLRTANPSVGKVKLDDPETATQLLKEAGVTDAEIKSFFKYRQQKADPKRQKNQQLAETVTLKIEVTPDAPLGAREVRVLTPSGLSNPLAFCIGDLPEQRKVGPLGKTLETAMQVPLPTVLNGQIFPGEVDHYAFQARRGAHLVVAVQARDLIPYLADAVPARKSPTPRIIDSTLILFFATRCRRTALTCWKSGMRFTVAARILCTASQWEKFHSLPGFFRWEAGPDNPPR